MNVSTVSSADDETTLFEVAMFPARAWRKECTTGSKDSGDTTSRMFRVFSRVASTT